MPETPETKPEAENSEPVFPNGLPLHGQDSTNQHSGHNRRDADGSTGDARAEQDHSAHNEADKSSRDALGQKDIGQEEPQDEPQEEPQEEPRDEPWEDPWEDELDDEGGAPMPLLGHLAELRTRLFRALVSMLVGFAACYAAAEWMYNELLKPLEASLPEGGYIIFTVLQGPFFIQLKLALLAGVMVTSPYIFYQIWAFIAPGLYAHERRYIVPIAALSAVFFLLGAAFCYFIVFPFALPFFLSFSNDIVRAQPDVGPYFSFVLKLLLAFGLIFEMPLFCFFLSRIGILTAAMMRSVRRYAVLAIFVIAAILTPPDIFTQLLMALPMLLLYEASILVAAVFGRKPSNAQQDESPADDHPDTEPSAGKESP